MKIFIDTNIFLTFYHFSNDDLEELKKLAAVLGDPRNTLYIPDQVKDEFKRNREAKIADALKRFQSQKMEDQFPQMCKEYPEYQEMCLAIKVFYKNKEKIKEKLITDISNNTLKADSVIESLISKSKSLPSDNALVELAKYRMELGNPPGKRGSLGDAINWEVLLREVPEKEDLYFISEDGDYLSPLSDVLRQNVLSKYLAEEWHTRKQSKIFFYQRLSEFLNDKFPDIKLASEAEKEILIKYFIESGSFQMTHEAVRKLSNIEHFTSTEVGQIIEAVLSNSQILSIIGDADVKAFMDHLLKNYKEVIDQDKKIRLASLLQDTEDTPTDDLPF